MPFLRFTLSLLLLLSPVKLVAQSDLDIIYKRTRSLLLSDTAYATEQSYRLTDDVIYTTDAKGYYASLGADGSWPDIDYHSQERSSWKPSWHFYRLMLLMREYHKNNDAKYLDAVHRAFKFWITADPQCPNWWQNQIDVPYAYSTVMLMLDKDVYPAEADYLNNVLVKRYPQKNPTGQNKIWQHDIEARIALFHHDNAAFALAMVGMRSVISVGVNEGIQPDNSFHQHGPMLQFGNYGLHFINSLLFWMTVSAKTDLAFGADKQQMIFDYCSDGIRWSVYKGAMDITAIGRQLRQDAAVKRGKNLLDDFNLLRSFDKADPCRYALDGLTDGCPLTGNKAFWRTDYMVNLKGGHYMMSVKTHGPGVSKVESINSENMKGAFLNDGVTLVQQSGMEYRNIEPLWNWAMLPGTTCDTTIDPASPDVFKTKNTGVFTGMVSDGVNGVSAMDYNRLGVKARKAYFFVDGMMVCLGIGLDSVDNKNVVSTVDQCFENGKVVEQGAWVWHNNTGYFFLNGPEPQYAVKKQSGSWNSINGAAEKDKLSGQVFTLYLLGTSQASYAYVVKPETDVTDMAALSKKIGIKVLRNTAAVQAIQCGSTTLAVFYKPSPASLAGLTVTVDKPCMVIYKKVSGREQIWVSDPTRTQSSIALSINGMVKTVALPQGDHSGSTVMVK